MSRSLFNRFDFVVVISSLLEVAITVGAGLPEVGCSVLRFIRLLRIFKGTVHLSIVFFFCFVKEEKELFSTLKLTGEGSKFVGPK